MSYKTTSKVKVPNTTVGLLSWTENMDAWSFSLPAGKDGSCPLMVDGPDTICGGCYAMINRYNMPSVLEAQWARLLWIKDLIAKQRVQEFVDLMTHAISVHVGANQYFRVHDSGDFFHPEYIGAWHKICANLPHIKFWFPTRSYLAKGNSWVGEFAKLNSLPNVTVRPSALKYNQGAPDLKGFAQGTSVFTDYDSFDRGLTNKVCPKTIKGGTCSTNNCRTCWDSPEYSVAYYIHGFIGRKRPPVISDKIKNTRLTIKGRAIEQFSVS